jgi:ribonuclease D
MDELLAHLKGIKLIAVDTEFFRETTYYPQLALVQIATDSIVACIDPLAFDAQPALKKILLDENITKIFHSCSQDMEVLYYYLGQTPNNIYDTQIANALLSEHQQIGYAKLVENELGAQLDKSQTRTNWLQRPLTEEQVQYAGDDVYYLYQLQHKLDTQLQDKGRKNWFKEETASLHYDESNFQVDKNNLWRRVKGSSRLNRNKLAIVQSIAVWREQLAQQKDKTRRKILSDDIVLDLAFNPPVDSDELQKLINNKTRAERRSHSIRFTGEQLDSLLFAIGEGRRMPEEQIPDNRFTVLDGEQKKILKIMQQLVTDKAESLGISSAMLYSKKDLEKLILQQDEQDRLMNKDMNTHDNWRYRCIGEQLAEAIKNN